MAMTVRNLRDALERPPPPHSWEVMNDWHRRQDEQRMGYRPLPPAPYRDTLPPVPWIIRGNNAALSLGAILLGALAALAVMLQ
jgi:hypothetical protein